MLYGLKTKVEDFFVKELLDFIPGEEGNFIYFLFQKQNINTMDIVNHICQKTGLTRHQIGIAGLKDKIGITQQRLSINQDLCNKIGGINVFQKILSSMTKILDQKKYNKGLIVGSNIGNFFEIKLRSTQKLNNLDIKLQMNIKSKIEEQIQDIILNGFPNFFGIQRFGKGLRNIRKTKDIILEYNKNQNLQNLQKDIRFNLQSYASYYFNSYLSYRIDNKIDYLDGDILTSHDHISKSQGSIKIGNKIYKFDYFGLKNDNLNKSFINVDITKSNSENFNIDNRITTGPMIGHTLILPPQQSQAYKIEYEILKHSGFLPIGSIVFQEKSIYGIRRPLFVYPNDIKYHFDNMDLILSFELPSGSYATTLLGHLFEKIDNQTYKQNRLEIKKTFFI